MLGIPPTSVPKPEEELGLSKILKCTLQLYWQNFPFLALVYLAVQVAILLVPPLAPSFNTTTTIPFNTTTTIPFNTTTTILSEQVFALEIIPILVTLGVFLLLYAVITLADGLVVKEVVTQMEGQASTPIEKIAYTLKRFPVLLAAELSMWGLTAFPLSLLGDLYLIPYLLISAIFALVVQIIIAERAGFLASFTRSRKMTSRRWSKVMLLVLLIFLLQEIAPAIPYFLLNSAAPGMSVVIAVTSNLTSVLAGPLPPLMFTLLYYSLLHKAE